MLEHWPQFELACGQCATVQWSGKQLPGPLKGQLHCLLTLVLVVVGMDLTILRNSQSSTLSIGIGPCNLWPLQLHHQKESHAFLTKYFEPLQIIECPVTEKVNNTQTNQESAGRSNPAVYLIFRDWESGFPKRWVWNWIPPIHSIVRAFTQQAEDRFLWRDYKYKGYPLKKSSKEGRKKTPPI